MRSIEEGGCVLRTWIDDDRFDRQCDLSVDWKRKKVMMIIAAQKGIRHFTYLHCQLNKLYNSSEIEILVVRGNKR